MSDIDVHTAARNIAALAQALAPRLLELGELIAPELERELWPAGPPDVVTWSGLWQGQLERLRESTEAIIREDVEAAQRGESSPETAARAAAAKAALQQAHYTGPCFADEIVFGDDPPLSPLPLLDLFVLTTQVMTALASSIDRGASPGHMAKVLGALLGDVITRMIGALHACGRSDAATQLEELLPELAEFEQRLADAEAAEPAVHPTAPNGEATVALLERLAARIREIAPVLADVVDREIFGGAPPPRLSFHAIQVAIDAAHYGDDVPEHVRRVHEMVAESDRIIVPDDDEPISARELLEGTAWSIDGAAKKLRALPADERDEVAAGIELQARLFILGVVSIGQSTHRQLLVAELAAAVGLNPIPFPGDLQGGGSA